MSKKILSLIARQQRTIDACVKKLGEASTTLATLQSLVSGEPAAAKSRTAKAEVKGKPKVQAKAEAKVSSKSVKDSGKAKPSEKPSKKTTAPIAKDSGKAKPANPLRSAVQPKVIG